MPNQLLIMDEVTLVRNSFQLIRKDFGLEEDLDFKKGENESDRLEDFLTKHVDYLLDHDFNRLLNILYRIDIPENQLKELLQESNQGEIARNMAIAIITRQKQKVITRQKYQP